jgi:hypothetical protein
MIHDFEINDTCGNGNNTPEFDEDLLISTIIKNLGSEDASQVNIKLTTNDSYVEIIEGDEYYDTIRKGEFIDRAFAYKVYLSDAIPDQHQIQFDVIATDENDSTWKSEFLIEVDAPRITLQDMIIDDSEFGNDNGKLDAGETATIKMKTSNKGSCVITDVECKLVPYNQFITVEEESVNLSQLSLVWPSFPEFTVTVSEDAPEAVIAQMNYYVSAAGYNENKIYRPKIGQFVENFETGDFEKYDWVMGGDEDWKIDFNGAHEGYFHAKSGEIGDGESSQFSISYTTMTNDNISFYRKVSSEPNGDNLEFYIDNKLRGKWSGSRSYGQESFFISAGEHTFKWIYKKDNGGVDGMDAAFIDYIELPTKMVTTLFAGPDQEICLDNEFRCEGSATNQATVEWTTSGDGSFDFADHLTPLYTHGEQDAEAGFVTLTLTIIDSDGEEYADDMVLTFLSAPEAPVVPEGPDYVDVYKQIETTYSIPELPDAVDYLWVLEPEEAGTLTVSDNQVTIYWDIDYLGEAYLTASVANECGMSTFSEPLVIFIDNTVGFSEFDEKVNLNIAPNPNQGYFKIIISTIEEDRVDVKLVNYLGSEVFSMENIDASRGFDYQMNARYLPQGIYVLIVEQNGRYYSKKVMISR